MAMMDVGPAAAAQVGWLGLKVGDRKPLLATGESGTGGVADWRYRLNVHQKCPLALHKNRK